MQVTKPKKMPWLYDYVCKKCGKPFDELAQIQYFEYAGASAQVEDVSPCCRARYDDNYYTRSDHERYCEERQCLFDEGRL